MEIGQKIRLDMIKDILIESCVHLKIISNEQGDHLDYQIIDLNKQAEKLLGMRSDVMGKTLQDIMVNLDCNWEDFKEKFKQPSSYSHEEFVFQTNRRILVSCFQLANDEILLFFVETTFHRKAQEIMPLHEILFEHAQDIILYIRIDGQIIDANQKAILAYGYGKEQLLTKKIQDLRHKSTLKDFPEQMDIALKKGIVFESIHVRADGSQFPVEVSVRTVQINELKLRIHIIRDITKRKVGEAKIARLAKYDTLTGILNRRSILAKLDQEIKRAKANKSQFALLLFDIDKFKGVNDLYGHQAGDLVLKKIVNNVGAVLRSTDSIGRLGGDEFIILVREIKSSLDVTALVDRIIKVVNTPITYKTEKLQVTTSLGISLFPDDATKAEELLHLADHAMYKTKHNGGNGFTFH